MSRYVARFSCVLCLLLIFSAIFWCSDARAQAQPVYYKVIGTDFQVSPAGTPAYNTLETTCPLRTMYMDKNGGPKKFEDATKAAKAAGDPDSAPFAISPDGKDRVYFDLMDDCRAFFRELARQANPKNPPVELACGAYPPGAYRGACKNQEQARNSMIGQMGGAMRLILQAPPTNGDAASEGLSQESIKQMQEAKKQKTEAERACFEGTMDRVGQYWLKQNAAECVQRAVKYIKWNIKHNMKGELKHFEKKQGVNLKSDGQGTSPGAIISMPSIIGVGQALVSAIKYALAIGVVAAENADDLNYLLNNCLKMSDSLKNLQVWRKGVLGGLCKQVESLVERQLTQCIRVSAQFDLKLPQFSAALQCPFNVNITAYVGTQGSHFDWSCVQSSPVSGGTWGGRSLLGASGGLENLFSGKCFSLNGTSPTGASGGGRVPGVDCGTVATNEPVRNEALQGVVYLTPGNPTANGWVAGRSETVVSPSGISQQITRCDFYTNSARTRTTYVYGSGASCNASATGFTANGYETSVACYGGSYTPASAGGAAPDACLYPLDCLNQNDGYVFDDARLGQNGCPANTQAALDVTRRYPAVLSTGGVGGGTTEWRSCSDFSEEIDQAPVCCDPQKQDCREARTKNIPICQCDQGDSTNVVIDQTTGKCDPAKGGGMRTCCTASLNGGTEGCTTQVGMPASQVCANGDQCMAAGDVAGTDGNGNPITAGSANTSKPSPFSYLALRPDVTLTGITNSDGTPKQCCTTPWCNVCPQHYANAYGMSMARANWTLTRPPATASLATVRNYNNAILGKGWPFTTATDANGETTYTIGINPASITITRAIRVPGALGIGAKWEEDETTASVSYPMLHLSDKMELKPSAAQMDDCNDIGQWKIGYTSGDNFGTSNASALGYVYDAYVETPSSNKYSWKVLAPMPEPRETPMDYLNRLQSSSVDANGTPKEPIELCSDVIKICAPGTNPTGGVGAPTGGAPTGGRLATTNSTTTLTTNSANGSGMIPMTSSTTSTNSTATTNSGSTATTSGRAAPATSTTAPIGAAVVPGTGASGSLF